MCFSKCCWLLAPAIKVLPIVLLYCIVFEVVDEVDEDELDAPAPPRAHHTICMFSPCRLVNRFAQIEHARSGNGGGGGGCFFDGWDVGIPKQFPIFSLRRCRLL